MRQLAFAGLMLLGVIFVLLAAGAADFGEWSVAVLTAAAGVGCFLLAAAALRRGVR